jgi:hypothetical protein
MGGQVAALFSLVAIAAVIAVAAGLAVRRLEPAPAIAARVRRRTLFAIVLAAMALAAATRPGEVGPADARVMLAGLMAAAAWVDRQSAWVPDVIFLPMMALAGVVGAPLGGGPMQLIGGALAGLAVYALCLGLWHAVRRFGRPGIPPADLAALALPLLLFGFDLAAGATYTVVSALLLAARQSPRLRDILSPRAPIAAALADTGHEASRTAEAVAFLSVMLASTLAVLILDQAPRPDR